MLINASKEVGSAMNVHHDSSQRFARLLPLVGIGAHLNPLSLELGTRTPPLPPLPSSNLADAFGAKLLLDEVGGTSQVFVNYGSSFHLDPLRVRNPLRCECLEFLNCVVGSKLEKCANQVQALVIREVRRRLLLGRFLVQILHGA
jgi:hypothetical protein